ncbi:protein mono-ADP-ribosyltransferase PARP3 isoform X2 [Hyalella azteca]|uniref:NAD(+) ADP-ribosyltransferase n=1 Tax=Hyalella azteca TaxID=294128 RepID=A0A8B7NAZ9_HYAAZ|nr:protein mono-ADP-ribosyltransferase PARP3 isoform X2 [Hyalella azteca]
MAPGRKSAAKRTTNQHSGANTKKSRPNDETTSAGNDATEVSSEQASAAGNPILLDPLFAKHLNLPDKQEIPVYKDYSCTLTRADIAINRNEFYVIQMTKVEEKYHVCFRYGRVRNICKRQNGESNLQATKRTNRQPKPRLQVISCASEAEAEKVFCKKFKEKTGNEWENRSAFVTKPNKYTLLEIDLLSANSTAETSDDDSSSAPIDGLNFDPQEMPLGQLSNNQILKGLEALKDVLKDGSQKTKIEAMSRFYMYYPCDVGGNDKKLLLPSPAGNSKKLLLPSPAAIKELEKALELILDNRSRST